MNKKQFGWFYKIFPALLMCYLLPALLSTFNIISPKTSSLWPIAKNYFLPASLILMTLSTDIKGIMYVDWSVNAENHALHLMIKSLSFPFRLHFWQSAKNHDDRFLAVVY